LLSRLSREIRWLKSTALQPLFANDKTGNDQDWACNPAPWSAVGQASFLH
jgi:hypothetical protein